MHVSDLTYQFETADAALNETLCAKVMMVNSSLWNEILIIEGVLNLTNASGAVFMQTIEDEIAALANTTYTNITALNGVFVKTVNALSPILGGIAAAHSGKRAMVRVCLFRPRCWRASLLYILLFQRRCRAGACTRAPLA